jgi:hypothetical protein
LISVLVIFSSGFLYGLNRLLPLTDRGELGPPNIDSGSVPNIDLDVDDGDGDGD